MKILLQGIHTWKYESHTSSCLKITAKVKVGKSYRSKSSNKKLWYGIGLVKRSGHVKYESPFYTASKIMAKVNLSRWNLKLKLTRHARYIL